MPERLKLVNPTPSKPKKTLNPITLNPDKALHQPCTLTQKPETLDLGHFQEPYI